MAGKSKKGRPPKYNADYCKTILSEMSKGLSKEAACGEIGIHKDTLYDWARKYPEFSDAIKKGEAKGRNLLEKAGLKAVIGLKPKGYCAYTWGMLMKNRFRWSDRALTTENDEAEEKPKLIINRHKPKPADG